MQNTDLAVFQKLPLYASLKHHQPGCLPYGIPDFPGQKFSIGNAPFERLSLDIEEFPSILRIPVTLPVPRPFLLFHMLSPVTIIITSDIISKSASSNSFSFSENPYLYLFFQNSLSRNLMKSENRPVKGYSKPGLETWNKNGPLHFKAEIFLCSVLNIINSAQHMV